MRWSRSGRGAANRTSCLGISGFVIVHPPRAHKKRPGVLGHPVSSLRLLARRGQQGNGGLASQMISSSIAGPIRDRAPNYWPAAGASVAGASVAGSSAGAVSGAASVGAASVTVPQQSATVTSPQQSLARRCEQRRARPSHRVRRSHWVRPSHRVRRSHRVRPKQRSFSPQPVTAAQPALPPSQATTPWQPLQPWPAKACC